MSELMKKIFWRREQSYQAVEPRSPEEPYDDRAAELNEKADFYHSERLSRWRKAGRLAGTLIIACGALSFILLGLTLIHNAQSPSEAANEHQHQRQRDGPICGNSSTEAIERGCTFDRLMWSWYPPSCPHLANDAFINAEADEGGWKYFSNPYTETEVIPGTLEWWEAVEGQQIWTEKREHVSHCLYVFLALGMLANDPSLKAIPKLYHPDHQRHCVNYISGELKKLPDWHKLNTHAPAVVYDEDCEL